MTKQPLDEEAIFLAALEKQSEEERNAFVEEACANRPNLMARVRELLGSHDESMGPLDSPIASINATIDQLLAERTGTQIGPYKLLQQIGEGGMGTVFMADQTQPVQRKVALKLIKPGMDSGQIIARFEAERQALAIMDHVNIARVLDAGATESGRPYFVMELINGVPITKYCDDNHLTPRQRLELFVPVCQAIQHAHQKGIIHRDIKPSNVMITLYDGKPVPKVIDFGVAKATEQKLTERTLFTQFGTMVGTLEYMSPEQAEMSALGVDTRSDIYSLGVLLYELLTGSTPLTHKRMKEAAYGEILRMIKEEEPPRPSTRLSDSGESLASISAQRHMEPEKLTKLVRGELDWIIMKALEKDRNRRYEAANDFAADVLRYLNDEPVQACPPSAGYRFRKFSRRHRSTLMAAVLILLALVGGVISTTIGLIRVEEARQAEVAQRKLAEANEQKAITAAEAEKKSNEIAQAREAETRAVLAFVQDKIFAAARPEGQAGGLGGEVTLRKAVEASLPFVADSFKDQPLIEARLRMTLGLSFLYLSDAKIANEQFESARALYMQKFGREHQLTLQSMNNLGNSYAALGRHAEALKLREETLTLMKANLGPDHPDTLRGMNNLADSYTVLDRHTEALQLREETLALRKVTLPDHPETLTSMGNLANSYAALGRPADALKLREETLAVMKAKLGPDNLLTLHSMNNLAVSYAAVGRHADALKLREETLALRKVKLGPAHASTLSSMNDLANSYSDLGRHADALKLREETLALGKAKFGPDHPATIGYMGNLANGYAALGRQTEALNLYEETLALQKAKLGPNHSDTLMTMANLTSSYSMFGRHADALQLSEETLTLTESNLGPHHPDTLMSMFRVAASLANQDRSADAVPIIDECLRRAAGKIVHPQLIPDMMNLRLRQFEKIGDAVGCLETADKWEGLKRSDTESLYNSACFRSVCAAVIRDTDATPTGQVKSKEQADQAMAWLTQAVAAGFKDASYIEKDIDLAALRDREDFRKLLTELVRGSP
jgi:serine/threonine protein kinase/tetratricopeptide (TPR) repeat protein